MRKIFIVLLLSTVSFGICATEIVHLWSGEEQSLPGTGKWMLTAAHGRILASGDGEPRFYIPALVDGTTLDADLIQNDIRKKIRFHSQKPLTGLTITVRDLPEKKKKRLIGLGVSITQEDLPEICFSGILLPKMECRLLFVFPDRNDFPLNIGKNHDSISLLHVENRGNLSLFLDNREQILDLNGNIACAILRNRDKRTIILFPDFNLSDLENILFIQQTIKEESQK